MGFLIKHKSKKLKMALQLDSLSYIQRERFSLRRKTQRKTTFAF